MHVALLSAEFPPRWGGMGSTVYHLSSSLANRGHRVTVITRNSGGKTPRMEGVRVLKVPWARIPMAFTRSYGRWALRALEKLHYEDPVDVVHVHCPMISWSDAQFERCASKVAPVVSSMHGTWLGERDGLLLAAEQGEPAVWGNPNDMAIRYMAGRYARYEESAIRKSAVVVPNSKATRTDLEQRYSAPVGWVCEVIHWGIDTDMFVPLHRDSEDAMHRFHELRGRYGATADSNFLLAVGRLAARKGHGMLLRAFAKVVSEAPDSHLVIVGRGNLRRKLARMAGGLGVSDRVWFEPGMDFEEIAEMYRIADLIVYPSYYEGQGLIPLEAMASGTPVATVDHGPLPEMVDASVGALFELGDADSMAETILSEISSKEALLSKGATGRKRVLDRFSLEGNADDFLSVYERAINGPKPQGTIHSVKRTP